MTSKQLIKKIRSYVEQHGITGGNPVPTDGYAACPRGLVLYLSGEADPATGLDSRVEERNIFGFPKYKAAREVLSALDKAAKRRKAEPGFSTDGLDLDLTSPVIGDGAYSEGFARGLCRQTEQRLGLFYANEAGEVETKRALAWIDSAAATL